MANNFMRDYFAKIAPGMCRITMKGNIAVKTDSGDYKYYNVKTGRLTNCSQFVFDIGKDFFFVVPTTKVNVGDIILVDDNGIRKPRCVKEVKGDSITVINYNNSTIETILPERHIFMGNVFFYSKIVSMFGSKLAGKKGLNSIFKYMMLSEMMKGSENGTNGSNNMFNGNMLPMMMFMNGNGGGFDELFDFDFDGSDLLPDIADDTEDANEDDDE